MRSKRQFCAWRRFKVPSSMFKVWSFRKLRNEPNLSCLSIFIHIRMEMGWDVPAIFTKRTHSRYSCPLVFIRGSNRFLRNEAMRSALRRRKGEGVRGRKGAASKSTGDFYQTNPSPSAQFNVLGGIRLNPTFEMFCAKPIPVMPPLQGSIFVGDVYPGRRCALPWAIILPSLQDSRSEAGNYQTNPNSARGPKFLHQRYPRNPRLK